MIMAMSASLSDRARALLANGNVAAAITLVTDAARRGNGEALHELALWRVFGQPLPRDFTEARCLFGRAGEAGHRAAALTYAVFVATGAGGRANWQEAMRLLDRAAQGDPVAARQKALLAAMALDRHGAPAVQPSPEPISESPKVAIARQLFTAEECAHVVALAQPLLMPSVVVDPATGRQMPHPIRTSNGAVLGPVQMDLVVEALNRRIAAVTGTRIEQGEPLTVLRYAPGQQYRLHHDCLPGEVNQRVKTLIMYLNDDFGGGATHFPAIDARIRGHTGDAVLFANTRADGHADELSRHAGLPVTRGEKWICTRWIRSHDFDPWGMRHR